MKKDNVELNLDNSFFIDLDGTILLHKTSSELEHLIKTFGENSHKYEKLLKGVKEWFDKISEYDKVYFVTARPEFLRDHTQKVLKYFGIPFDGIIFGANAGPRIIINDIKPKSQTGFSYDFNTAYAINVERNEGFEKVRVGFI